MATNELFCEVGPNETRERFAKAARELGLEPHAKHEGDNDKVAYEEIWATPDHQNAIRWVEDPISGLTFLRFQGAKRRKMLRDLKISIRSPEEVIEMDTRLSGHDLALEGDNDDDEAFADQLAELALMEIRPCPAGAGRCRASAVSPLLRWRAGSGTWLLRCRTSGWHWPGTWAMIIK